VEVGEGIDPEIIKGALELGRAGKEELL